MQMHAGQLTVSVETVRALVDLQFPHWSALPVTATASSGTVNAIFRIGDSMAARFPLLQADPVAARETLAVEAAAARRLLGRTRVPTPEPLAIGEPGLGYPMPWSIQTWLPGTIAAEQDVSDSVEFALGLADFVADVRDLGTEGCSFTGTGRGGDLRARDAWMQECFDRSEGLLEVVWLRRTWQQFRRLPRTSVDAMTHGDLIPGNLLVSNRRLIGVLDVGDLAPADPALDLVGSWHVLNTVARQAFRARLGCDDLDWARGAAWAFDQAVGVVWYYATTNPVMSAMGRRTLQRIAADPPV